MLYVMYLAGQSLYCRDPCAFTVVTKITAESGESSHIPFLPLRTLSQWEFHESKVNVTPCCHKPPRLISNDLGLSTDGRPSIVHVSLRIFPYTFFALLSL